MMGSRAIRTARSTAGSREVIRPRMTGGQSLINPRKGTFSVKKLMFEMAPTTATGIAQKMIRVTTAPMVAAFLIISSHHLILKFDQMISFGLRPMYRGAMWRGWL
ncbi:hypothetical protein ACKS0A_04156 [Histoplasma ohiense]